MKSIRTNPHNHAPEGDERTVHAFSSLEDVVRYDRAGKWFLEGNGTRKPVTVDEAAYWAARPSFIWNEGMPGGRRFDALVRRYMEVQP